MELILKCVIIFLIVHSGKCAMSEKQLKAATKLIRNVCQPKTKVTNELIDAMHKGEFIQDPTLMCYTECCLRVGKLTKDGKLDLVSITKQAETLPDNRRQTSIDASTFCKDLVTSPDKCTAGFEIYKCIHDFNPENFFLP